MDKRVASTPPPPIHENGGGGGGGGGGLWSFTSASGLVIYISKLPLGACMIWACSISKLRKWIDY